MYILYNIYIIYVCYAYSQVYTYTYMAMCHEGRARMPQGASWFLSGLCRPSWPASEAFCVEIRGWTLNSVLTSYILILMFAPVRGCAGIMWECRCGIFEGCGTA